MQSKITKNIVLLGMRGSGKSAIGRTLAEYLDWQFLDIDHELEKGEGEKISEIVAKHDWPHFRDLETKYAKRAAEQKNTVIATGGGVVLRPENITALKANGVLVLITAPLAHLARRVAKDTSRPSLTGADPASELEKVWQERKELYEKAADVTVDFDFHTDNKKTDLLRKSKLILKAVKGFLATSSR